MKKIKCLSFALVALMLGACSSDEIVIVDDNGGKPQWNDEGKGYVNLAISLPTTQGTRGVNDDFNDGLATEYDVKDATLILFNDGKIHSAYDMELSFRPDETKPITSVARITQEINAVEETTGSTAGIQALVVLNSNGVFTVDKTKAKLSVGTGDNKDMEGKTLDELNTAIKDAQINSTNNWHEDGFLMSNALLAKGQGGGVEPSGDAEVLVTIDGDKIHDTRTEADNDPAAIIYVERAVAKVEVKTTLTEGKGTLDDENMQESYTITDWCLDNTNNTSKLVRTTAGYDTWKGYKSEKLAAGYANPYRFVGGTAVGKDIDDNDLYRVYWGEDFNYTSTPNGDLSHVDENATWKAVNGDPLYCFENTADMETMLEENCTRVIVKAQFNGGTPFYILDDTKNKIWNVDDVPVEIGRRILADSDVQKWATENLVPSTDPDNPNEFLSTDFEITLSNADEDGIVTVTGVSVKSSAESKLITDYKDLPTGIVTKANNYIKLEYYADGVAYYGQSIAHFGEELTPWGESYEENSVYGDETSRDAKYLGRWGVLRNNWYELNINSITGIGSPTVTGVTGSTGTIDKKESFISFTIKVLAWAKRSQSVVL